VLTVWGRKSSFNVQKVMWLVGELGITHEHMPAGGDFGGLDTPAFLAMNPHGHVPVIRDGDVVVWESHAILRYLAAAYGQGRFWTDSPAERSQADRWMDWSQASLGTVARLGVKRRLSFAGRCRWLAGTSVRSRNRACHCRRRSEPGAAGRRRVATSASAATCSSGGSPGSWRFLR